MKPYTSASVFSPTFHLIASFPLIPVLGKKCGTVVCYSIDQLFFLFPLCQGTNTIQ